MEEKRREIIKEWINSGRIKGVKGLTDTLLNKVQETLETQMKWPDDS